MQIEPAKNKPISVTFLGGFYLLSGLALLLMALVSLYMSSAYLGPINYLIAFVKGGATVAGAVWLLKMRQEGFLLLLVLEVLELLRQLYLFAVGGFFPGVGSFILFVGGMAYILFKIGLLFYVRKYLASANPVL